MVRSSHVQLLNEMKRHFPDQEQLTFNRDGEPLGTVPRSGYIPKPRVTHPSLPKNKLGLTTRSYEGAVSTLCAGCGHDSVTAAIIQAVFELNIEPHMLAKMSGIGCSSKTPAYFVKQSHGFNSVHGRMPSVTTGANMATVRSVAPAAHNGLNNSEARSQFRPM